MKRGILSAFLAVTIIGLSVVSISSKSEVNKMAKATLIDCYGNKEALGNKKFITAFKYIDDYSYQETKVSKNGIESNGNTKGNFYALTDRLDYYSLDKNLIRGFDSKEAYIGEKFSVALNYKFEKGLIVRYKENDKKEHREFSINDEKFIGWNDIEDIYIKNDLLYVVIGNTSKYCIVKISLTSEKLLKIVDFPHEARLNRGFCTKNDAVVKDNKIYITADHEDVDKCTFKVFTYDLEKDNFSYKTVIGNNSPTGVRPGKVKTIPSVDRSLKLDGNLAFYSNYNGNKEELDILVYDMVEDKLRELSINEKEFGDVVNIDLRNCKIEKDKLYLGGLLVYSNHSVTVDNGFVAVYNLSKSSLEYLGYIDNGLLDTRTLTDIK